MIFSPTRLKMKIVHPFLTFFLLLLTLSPAFSQKKKTCNVAIVVHEGVELFDFAGPGEVFAAASRASDVVDIHVFTVAPNKEPVTSQTFLSINPTYSIANTPEIDLLVIPGGQTGVLLNDAGFMAWVEREFPKIDHLLTVCTGAFVPAKLGLLDGMKATTHHGSISSLKENYPTIDVIEDIKFIDNDKIITSGGVSSGTEGALHMIQRISGVNTAQEVARYMEYDHWKPDLGMIAYENPSVKKLGEMNRDGQEKNFERELGNITTADVDFGELEAYGLALLESGQLKPALQVFQRMTKIFPPSVSLYERIGKIYTQMGKEAPPTQKEFHALIEEQGVPSATEAYNTWMETFPGWKIWGEGKMNSLGYRYLLAGKLEEAIGLFALNTKAYPDSWNCWDSLAEGYMRSGDYQKAMEYCKKSLKLNPDNEHAEKMIAKMASGKE